MNKFLGNSVTHDQLESIYQHIRQGIDLDLYDGDYWIINGVKYTLDASVTRALVYIEPITTKVKPHLVVLPKEYQEGHYERSQYSEPYDWRMDKRWMKMAVLRDIT